MNLASWEIAKAIYLRLNGNLTGNIPVYEYGSSYDDPFTKDAYFVEVGPLIPVNDSSKGNPGEIITVQFHVWGNEPKNEKVYSIMSNIVNLMTVSEDVTPNFLSLSGFTVANQFYDGGPGIVPTGNNKTRHGVFNIEITV